MREKRAREIGIHELAHRDQAEFVRQAVFYVGVFAASTVVAVFYRFT